MIKKKSENKKVRPWFFATLVVVIVLISVVTTFYFWDFGSDETPLLGVTFNAAYARNLGLDWKETYLALLDDLHVKHIRISAPWDEIEGKRGVYYYDDLDWQIEEAAARGVSVIVVVGRRTPRWPECHDPAWITDLDSEEVQQEQLQMVRDIVTHVRAHQSIVMWQVENEPFLDSFGECPRMEISFLKDEVALVKSLDDRPILITDSGELSTWLKTAPIGDKFGHTLYRLVYNGVFGYFYYYLPPAFYRYKAAIVGIDTSDQIIAELQAEPWVAEGYTLDLDYEEMTKLMSPEKIESNLLYGRRTGASELYLWGAEWWYWMKTVKGDATIWDFMKEQTAVYK